MLLQMEMSHSGVDAGACMRERCDELLRHVRLAYAELPERRALEQREHVASEHIGVFADGEQRRLKGAE